MKRNDEVKKLEGEWVQVMKTRKKKITGSEKTCKEEYGKGNMHEVLQTEKGENEEEEDQITEQNQYDNIIKQEQKNFDINTISMDELSAEIEKYENNDSITINRAADRPKEDNASKKIRALEYQNLVNLQWLEEHMLKEERLLKQIKELETHEDFSLKKREYEVKEEALQREIDILEDKVCSMREEIGAQKDHLEVLQDEVSYLRHQNGLLESTIETTKEGEEHREKEWLIKKAQYEENIKTLSETFEKKKNVHEEKLETIRVALKEGWDIELEFEY